MSHAHKHIPTIPIESIDELDFDPIRKPLGVIAPAIINHDNQLSGFVHSVETGAAVDGPGVRFVLFTSGCQFRCLYCHNPDTWKLHNGKLRTVDEMVKEIGKYARFLKFAGGVTFSGGEPMMQAHFIGEIAYRVKEQYGLHIALDTQGFLASHLDDAWFDHIDLVMLDIKHIDPDKYLALTSQPLQPTLDFVHRLVRMHKPMWIRYVVVPGLTDDLTDVENHARFLHELKAQSIALHGHNLIERVEILPFHNLGAHKWQALNLTYTLNETSAPSAESLHTIKEIYKKYRLPVV
ncbi:pyruvate formate-lyase-activating protein [Wohlfahrtiimonas chitiniclastica]|uniref:pyruvate formate-lyase-activating protein n=1 Tax=Wohlfahrtiimonas chitiniclastica TaxID=400946 RepID=UPI000B997092|nr:pyruvate formate-lyase-activating protein [Wohlfahrtiimonas chitiniclastica]OYQ76157.1 pyruvate formate-lyase 1-activating enzyme [Wohlfahrtiimonas chitiniclastica]